jgi:hypothetical protein
MSRGLHHVFWLGRLGGHGFLLVVTVGVALVLVLVYRSGRMEREAPDRLPVGLSPIEGGQTLLKINDVVPPKRRVGYRMLQ